MGMAVAGQLSVAQLPGGAYQFCTEPDPQNGQDGAGVCLNFVKQGTRLTGYYGYPHSDAFVCLRGQVAGPDFSGEAYVVSWGGNVWTEVPATPPETASPEPSFIWDDAGRLLLGPGEIAQTIGEEMDQISWVFFRQARLDLQGLYQYAAPRMKPPAELCDWSFLQNQAAANRPGPAIRIKGQKESHHDESFRHNDPGSSHHSQLRTGR
jgi:hypothetical protein